MIPIHEIEKAPQRPANVVAANIPWIAPDDGGGWFRRSRPIRMALLEPAEASARRPRAGRGAAAITELSTSLAALAAGIDAEHNNVRQAASTTMEHGFRTGELLLEAKRLVLHGYWGDWLHKHCDLSERSAQNYMRLAPHRANPQLTADSTIDDTLKPLANAKLAEIDDANLIVNEAGACLPNDGQARIGILSLPGCNMEFETREVRDAFSAGVWKALLEFDPDALNGDTP